MKNIIKSTINPDVIFYYNQDLTNNYASFSTNKGFEYKKDDKKIAKAKTKPKAKHKAKTKHKTNSKAKAKDKAKAKANVPTKKGRRTRIVGGGSAEFFE